MFFSCKILVCFIEKLHILRITHFSETTKDRNLIFGMGGDANVKLCIQHFLSPGSSPPHWGICFKKCDRDPHPKPYIFMIGLTRQIKCIIAQAPGGHTPPPTWSEDKTKDFDLQLGCCISDAFSNFFILQAFLAELQQSCSRLMFWRKAGGRAYVSLSSLTL